MFIEATAIAEYPGSIVGHLDGPQQVRHTKAFIIDQLTGRQIALTYPADLIERVRAAWGHLVEISGTVTTNAAGEPRSIHGTEIHQFGAPVKFSTIFGLLEHDDTFDPDAYLASIRA